MRLKAANKLAVDLLRHYGLTGWQFVWMSGDETVLLGVSGRTDWPKKLIMLSRPIARYNNEDVVRDILLHEIAHALTPYHGHDYLWAAVAKAIGYKALVPKVPKWMGIFAPRRKLTMKRDHWTIKDARKLLLGKIVRFEYPGGAGGEGLVEAIVQGDDPNGPPDAVVDYGYSFSLRSDVEVVIH